MNDAPVKISIRSLYKIFGANPAAMMRYVTAGMPKADLLSKHQHVLGLNDINIDIFEGEITVIMGLSGSGKSTLIRHINRLIEPTAGEILIDGRDLLACSGSELRQIRRADMSMVFQNFALLPHCTVIENTKLALRISHRLDGADEVARHWLNRVGLQGLENQYPDQLSGGMKQRVGIARALTSNAPVMLMDEAFSALDPLIRTDMQALLLELQAELRKTIIFITHDLDEALKIADRLVILKDGGVVQKGDPQHILLNPSDAYIEAFLCDINRARVLRVGSVMAPLSDGGSASGALSVDHRSSLEQVMAMTRGDATKTFAVTRDGTTVGTIDLSGILTALMIHVSTAEHMRPSLT
jgi:glycine betaine/proline transport system ATP-binding protein